MNKFKTLLILIFWSFFMNDVAMANGDCPKVKFSTNKGDMLIELYCDKAPISSENFIQYVKDGFYDGTIFHRVIPGFMIQGGGFESGMNQKTTRANIQNEANNGVKNARATLSMARTPDPHSASSQFFVNLVDNAFLDFKSESSQGWGYAVFAQVVEGMDVVDAIAAVSTGNNSGHQDVPTEDVIVTSAELVNE